MLFFLPIISITLSIVSVMAVNPCDVRGLRGFCTSNTVCTSSGGTWTAGSCPSDPSNAGCCTYNTMTSSSTSLSPPPTSLSPPPTSLSPSPTSLPPPPPTSLPPPPTSLQNTSSCVDTGLPIDPCIFGHWSLDISALQTTIERRLAAQGATSISNLVIDGTGIFAISTPAVCSFVFSQTHIAVDVDTAGLTVHTDTLFNGDIQGSYVQTKDGEFCLKSGQAIGEAIMSIGESETRITWPLEKFAVPTMRMQYTCTDTTLEITAMEGLAQHWVYAYSRTTPSFDAGRVIAAARTQLGVPYSWGGGHSRRPGVTLGTCGPQYSGPQPCRADQTVGFDCSGLVRYAIFAGSAIDLGNGGNTVSQLADRHSLRITYEQRQPGDIEFFGNPPHHVILYTGNEMMIEAQQTNVPVHEVPLRTGGTWVRVR